MKKTHRFLIDQKINISDVTIDDKNLVHLIKNVLKLKVDEDCVIFSDNSNDFISKIKSINKNSVDIEVVSEIPKKEIPKKIIACISIIKRDNFELVVQKLTEIGVSEIIPILSDRTIKQSLRTDRLQKISDEALEQSGGSKRVLIHEPISLEDSLEKNKDLYKCYFDIEGSQKTISKNNELALYIGPEGGWSDSDKELFSKYNTYKLLLSNTVLRAETAAIVASYKLLWD